MCAVPLFRGFCLAALLAALLCPCAAAATLSPALEKFADECDSLRRGTILKLEDSLRGLRSGQTQTRNNAATIAQVERDLAALRGRQQIPVPQLRYPLVVGACGRLPGAGGHVLAVQGNNEMLVQCTFRVPVVVTRHYRTEGTVVKRNETFKLRGVATAGFSPASDAELPQVFRVTGRQAQRGADGSTTQVLVLEPFDMQPIEAYLRAKANP